MSVLVRTSWPVLLACSLLVIATALPGIARAAAKRRLGGLNRRVAAVRQPARSGSPSPRSLGWTGRVAAGPFGALDSAMLASITLAAAVALLLPAPLGVTAGLIVTMVLPGRLRRLEPTVKRRERQRIAADAPLAAELFAACVLGGADPVSASGVVARAVGGPLGRRLEAAGTAIRLGSDPAVVWAGLGSEASLAGWGSMLARASSSGAPVATMVLALAEQARVARRSRRAAAIRRASVWATVPLGVCFLPAFFLLGVVPVAVSVAGPVLGLLR